MGSLVLAALLVTYTCVFNSFGCEIVLEVCRWWNMKSERRESSECCSLPNLILDSYLAFALGTSPNEHSIPSAITDIIA